MNCTEPVSLGCDVKPVLHPGNTCRKFSSWSASDFLCWSVHVLLTLFFQDGMQDIYISGMSDRNRALNSDDVVVSLYPFDKWRVRIWVPTTLSLSYLPGAESMIYFLAVDAVKVLSAYMSCWMVVNGLCLQFFFFLFVSRPLVELKQQRKRSASLADITAMGTTAVFPINQARLVTGGASRSGTGSWSAVIHQPLTQTVSCWVFDHYLGQRLHRPQSQRCWGFSSPVVGYT